MIRLLRRILLGPRLPVTVAGRRRAIPIVALPRDAQQNRLQRVLFVCSLSGFTCGCARLRFHVPQAHRRSRQVEPVVRRDGRRDFFAPVPQTIQQQRQAPHRNSCYLSVFRKA